MSDLFTPLDPFDARLALRSEGLVAEFNRAGVVTTGDVHVARALTQLAHEQDERVLLAIALTCRALRSGSVCLDLLRVAEEMAAPVTSETDAGTDSEAAVTGTLSAAEVEAEERRAALTWPEPQAWVEAVRSSYLHDQGAVRLEGSLIYLDRYHQQESQVLDDLLLRDTTRPSHDAALFGASLSRVFPVAADGTDTYVEQRAACETAAQRWTSVITGGPGTGKTTTVAGLLVALSEQFESRGHRPRIALAAPTGKAAARLAEAVRDSASRFAAADRARLDGLTTGTLHKLLRTDPGNSTRFRHHRHNRLPFDVVVVDEASMISLTMTARLLDAMRPQARLVLVGDPDQLSSVDAGAILGDLVKGYGSGEEAPVAALVTTHRFSGGIAALAEALRQGDADAVVEALRSGHTTEHGLDVEWIQPDDASAALEKVTVDHALALRKHAAAGAEDEAVATLGAHRLLCAHRDGPYGVRTWNEQVERWLSDRGALPPREPFYVGRPVLVSENDYVLGVRNGDSGVVVQRPEGRRVVVDTAEGVRDFAPSRMNTVDTMHAMTIHKSQGSQAREVSVLLPSADSRLLTRELFYTAITRAQHKVRVIGSEEMVRAAVERTARRASGLAERLSERLQN